jgi:hypothetical protein
MGLKYNTKNMNEILLCYHCLITLFIGLLIYELVFGFSRLRFQVILGGLSTMIVAFHAKLCPLITRKSFCGIERSHSRLISQLFSNTIFSLCFISLDLQLFP